MNSVQKMQPPVVKKKKKLVGERAIGFENKKAEETASPDNLTEESTSDGTITPTANDLNSTEDSISKLVGTEKQWSNAKPPENVANSTNEGMSEPEPDTTLRTDHKVDKFDEIRNMIKDSKYTVYTNEEIKNEPAKVPNEIQHHDAEPKLESPVAQHPVGMNPGQNTEANTESQKMEKKIEPEKHLITPKHEEQLKEMEKINTKKPIEKPKDEKPKEEKIKDEKIKDEKPKEEKVKDEKPKDAKPKEEKTKIENVKEKKTC